MKMIAFEPMHLSLLVPREAVDMEQAIDTMIRLDGLGPAYTIIDGEEIIGCWGIVRLWGGVGEAWTVFSAAVARHPLWLHKTARRMIQDVMAGMGLDRLQVNVLAGSGRNCRWVERLGFHSEGTMERFGQNGEDYIRYALLRGV